MPTIQREPMPIRSEEDVVMVRHAIRKESQMAGFSLVDQTKIVTAASEIGRNTLLYGGGGELRIDLLDEDGKRGLRLTFEDKGPGIADIPQALRDGFTSGKGLGMGLGGAKRLVNEFQIESKPGTGTRVVLTKWK